MDLPVFIEGTELPSLWMLWPLAIRITKRTSVRRNRRLTVVMLQDT